MSADGGNGANGSDNKWIGKRTIRPDGVDKVTGRAAFGADFSLPGMLLGQGPAQPASPRPHQVDQLRQGRWRCPASRPS